MKFIEDGPSIPDELLVARDQGRVVFFCGAGVSCAKAELPNFFKLAKSVTENLGVSIEHPIMKVIREAKEIGKRTGVEGLISADRIFGLLEHDFPVPLIYRAVAKALVSHQSPPDLSAHKTLLRLATTREGLVRLVTTNFDRLFELCDPEIPSFTPPNLPNPSRATDFSGIVYLHGQVNKTSDDANGDGLVLSSSEFGQAYLSDGWATSFFKEILKRYCVVFVGYSADDPPVHYLLEALNKSGGQIDGVYAFQAGNREYANSKWRHKGVKAIPYNEANEHEALWDTLSAWADKSGDPDEWVRNVVEKAKSGPKKLLPHERGQVAHIVSTIEGLNRFSEGENPPPATWLYVFDPARRYAKPGYENIVERRGLYIDPFDLYSLDSDSPPDKIDSSKHTPERKRPKNAWDAFALNELDKKGLADKNTSQFNEGWAKRSPELVVRLSKFGGWISKVAAQPEAVWWAAHQSPLHTDIQFQITQQLLKNNSDAPTIVRKAWRYLFEFWSINRVEFHQNWSTLSSEVFKDGWSETALRHYSNSGKPFLKVEKEFLSGPVPNFGAQLTLGDLISLDVGYPELPIGIEIPDKWLRHVIGATRRNLEIAQELENEIGGEGLKSLSPFAADDDPNGEPYSSTLELSSWILYFVQQLERLLIIDVSSAKNEFQKWPVDDLTIFAKLRIWAIGKPELVPDEQLSANLSDLPKLVFWDPHHARDLLLAISARWSGLDVEARDIVEQLIMTGPERLENEDVKHFDERKAKSILNRLHWLHERDCNLQLNLEKVTEEFHKIAPNWKREHAKGSVKSFEGRSGWVRKEEESSALLDRPINTILNKAKNLSGHHGMAFVEHDPFAGLSKERPARAFAALRHAAKQNEFPKWAWQTFLNPERRKEDGACFTAFIGEQLSRFTASELSDIIRPVAEWNQKATKVLAIKYSGVSTKLTSQLVSAVAIQSADSSTAIVRDNEDIDWVMEAINSPTGKLAETLIAMPQLDDLKENATLPRAWIGQVETLLALPGDLRKHALVLFAKHLSWFFYFDPDWTKKNLLSVLEMPSKEDKQALLSGFLWGGKIHGYELFKILKPHLLIMAETQRAGKRDYTDALVALILSAWGISEGENEERWVPNSELRSMLLGSTDDLRSHILWQATRWTIDDQENWSPLLVELLGNVWPRENKVLSEATSVRLVEAAFSSETRFKELAEIVLPLITKFNSGYLHLPNFAKSSKEIVASHPRETLALLHAILPENVLDWPFEIEDTIRQIRQVDRTLNTDERLIELKRKWDSR